MARELVGNGDVHPALAPAYETERLSVLKDGFSFHHVKALDQNHFDELKLAMDEPLQRGGNARWAMYATSVAFDAGNPERAAVFVIHDKQGRIVGVSNVGVVKPADSTAYSTIAFVKDGLHGRKLGRALREAVFEWASRRKSVQNVSITVHTEDGHHALAHYGPPDSTGTYLVNLDAWKRAKTAQSDANGNGFARKILTWFGRG